jgi:transcriptional regulator of aromatic amino acid metabolism
MRERDALEEQALRLSAQFATHRALMVGRQPAARLPIAIVTRHVAELAPLAEIFAIDGVDAVLPRSAPGQTDAGWVLVVESGSATAVFEMALQARRQCGAKAHLVVCAREFLPVDRRVLLSTGASSLVRPSEWTPARICERVIGELILANALGPTSHGGLIGATAPMRGLFGQVDEVGPLPEPVLLVGEAGTEKDAVALELHRLSRRKGPLLQVDPSQPQQIEDELGGLDNGTIYVPEVSQLPMRTQVYLHGLLSRGRSDGHSALAPRVILATSGAVEKSAADGTFRPELLDVVSGFTLQIPALRDRLADLPILVRHMVTEFNRRSGTRHGADGTLDSLFRHSWPRNLDELRAMIWTAAEWASSDDDPINVLIVREILRLSRRPHRSLAA